jgi:protein transport protein SEC13
VAWAPFEYGLVLAAGTIDGRIYIISYNKKDGQWTTSSFVGHAESVNGISWAPSVLPVSQFKGA